MISVAIPCYCSENTIPIVVEELVEEFEKRDLSYQIVLVNDGSPDHTFSVIKEISLENPNIVAINLSKNYGQHAARMAAIPFLKGDYIVYMDDDGQHPVDGIFQMIKKLEEGNYDVVYALFKNKKHSGFKKLSSRINTATLCFLTGKPKDVQNSSFSVMRSYILREMRKYKSPFPSWTGFIMQITRNIANVELEHYERMEGKSNYTLKKMIKLYMDSMTGFSIVPLRFSSLVGVITAILGFLLGIYSIMNKIINPGIPVGYTSLISIFLFIGGMIMLMLGLVGEYIGRIYMINNNLPQYTIKEVIGEQKDDKE